MISQLLNPATHPASLWTVPCKRWAPSSPGTRRGSDVAQSTEHHNAVDHVCQGNMLKPIIVRWPNLSCWRSRSIPPHAASTRHPLAHYSQHIQPEPSIACLTWHIITVEIFVYFVRVPRPRVANRLPSPHSSHCSYRSQNPWLKQDAFIWASFGRKSLPEWGPLPAKAGCCGVCHVWQSWHSHCTNRGFLTPLFSLVSIQMCYWINPSPSKRLEPDSSGATPVRQDQLKPSEWLLQTVQLDIISVISYFYTEPCNV